MVDPYEQVFGNKFEKSPNAAEMEKRARSRKAFLETEVANKLNKV